MSLAVFSLLLGVFFYAAGFPMVMGDKKCASWRTKFLADTNAIRMASVVLLSVTAATLKYQWELTQDGEGLIVLLAWVTMLEGACMLLFPEWYGQMKSKFLKMVTGSDAAQSFWGFVAILLGAFFTYMGIMLP